MSILKKDDIKAKFEDLLNNNQQIKSMVEKYKDKPEILHSVMEEVMGDLIDAMIPFKHDVVLPITFLEDPYYCGPDPITNEGVAATLYPKLKEDFCEINKLDADYREVIISGAIGIGKSYFSSLGLMWQLYYLSCLKSPQKYFGLASTAKISIVIISITEKQAKKNIFFNIKEMIPKIPYFRDNFMFDQKKSADSLVFPNNVELFNGTSSVSSTIGLNIYSAVLDEANFFKVIKKSTRAKDATGEYDEAMTLYYNLLNRLDSRFMKKGVKPGIFYMCSSSVYPDDFTARRIKAAKESNNKTIYPMHYNLWEINRSKYSNKTFMVEVGGLNKRSRVLEGSEKDIAGQVINVPMDFYPRFKKDIDNAIRDLAGIALYSVQPFFTQPEKISEMFDSSLTPIFSRDVVTLSPKIEYMQIEHITRHKIMFPEKPRYVAMDIGLKHDRFGFAQGYIEDMVFVEKEYFNDETQKMDIVKVKMPKIVIELVLEIAPEMEYGEVELARVRFLIFQLKKFGYNIKYSSADGFQSKDMEQILKRNGVKHQYISVDKTTEPYETFRSALYENRVRAIHHPKLELEMNTLEKNYVNNTIDHPKRGCFAANTEIEMADGSFVRIDYKPGLLGKQCKTYNIENNVETTSEIIGWELTKITDRLLEIIFDNGVRVFCTEDHRFLLKDGSYIEAQYLTRKSELHHVKVFDIILNKFPVGLPVYDIQVANTHNFKLRNGCYVHNSKDVADAVCQVIYACHVDPHFHEDLLAFTNVDECDTLEGEDIGDKEMRDFLEWSRK